MMTGMPGTHIKMAGTGVSLLSPWFKIMRASSSEPAEDEGAPNFGHLLPRNVVVQLYGSLLRGIVVSLRLNLRAARGRIENASALSASVFQSRVENGSDCTQPVSRTD
jgi:hypothetical protein